MSDLRAFVALIAPYRVLGHCHLDMMRFFMQDDNHQLLLYPRAHQKSFIIACLAAWEIIRNPAITIIYATHTADLAISQLNQIKQILDSPIARKYWPELLNEVNNREKWSQDAISVDHWKRTEEGVRDYTVLAAGIGKATTGFHADLVIFDDVVVLENA